LTNEARYKVFEDIYSEVDGKLRDELESIYSWRSLSARASNKKLFTLEVWILISAQFKHLALPSIQQLHERPWCPVFKKAMVMLGNRLDQLAATEEEKLDLWMYAVRCYEMLMVRQMVMEAVEARPYTKYEETLSVFIEIMALGSFKEKFASQGWDGGSTRFYEKRQKFADLLQAAKTGERGEVHDHFREFYLRFSNLDTRPGRQDFVMHGSLTASTDEYPESVGDSLWNVFQETVPHLTSFTGASGPTATSGSGASGAGNRT
jgi:hypothetical protein